MYLLTAAVLLLLLYLAACFSALETALFALREQQTSLKTKPGSVERSKLAEAAYNPMALLQEVLLLGSLSNVLLAALGLHLVLHPLRNWGWSPWSSAPVIFGLGLVLVEIVPRSLALRAPEKSLRIALPTLMGVRGVFSPLARRLQALSDRLLDQIIPRRLRPRAGLELEEVETLIEMREEQGAISCDEASVLREILKLGGLTVKDCMTPRMDLPLMPDDASEEEALRMLDGARSRFVLVFDERADVVTLVVDSTLWRLARRPAWRVLGKPPVLVPETMAVLDCLKLHLPNSASAVVIADEYGSLEGMLSRANLLERMLGKAAPSLSSEQAIVSLGNGRYATSGLARIDDVNRELEVDLPTEGMDTIGGLVFTRLGYLPRPGEQLSISGVSIKVKRTARNRVQELELRINEPREEAAVI